MHTAIELSPYICVGAILGVFLVRFVAEVVSHLCE